MDDALGKSNFLPHEGHAPSKPLVLWRPTVVSQLMRPVFAVGRGSKVMSLGPAVWALPM